MEETYGMHEMAPASPPDYNSSVSHAPVPMHVLKTKINTNQNRVEQYTPNSEGKMIIKNRPSCLSIAFMLPYPFFCFGCCTSVSCDMIFDDNTQTITIKKWHGYLCCFAKSAEHIEYGAIGNIGFQRAECSSEDEFLCYPIIVLKDGTIFYIGDKNGISELSAQVLALHKFIFGRNHNARDYNAPNKMDLVIREPTASCCCV